MSDKTAIQREVEALTDKYKGKDEEIDLMVEMLKEAQQILIDLKASPELSGHLSELTDEIADTQF